ncbi:stage 0 sporulation protein YaaT [Candidatus Omnitrophus magneticus]|uniref:Stage 0 sporulation protein YaaT n=1 Tax=Candidatus Omnitrophus magneticus TaxID=1609969 RepID=A0A0F0CLL3_9BACT|nr:stage 0 sporulation protein YaaT [Candidatus Omnitrophus magneticus]
MKERILVKLREQGEEEYFLTSGISFDVGEKVIVEADKGLEWGEVIAPVEEIGDIMLGKPLRKIIRKVNPWDTEQITKNIKKKEELLSACRKRIFDHKLPMKLISAEYSFDRTKIVFYFTSETRVDFRELVKDLANFFRVRIELKQIGVRDEARLTGGCGSCGRGLCCGSFLKDFMPVTIKMAKTQNIVLNPTKISGLCGRLMCCLGYEYEYYKSSLKTMPKIGKEIKVEQTKGKVISINVLQRTATVDLGDGNLKVIKVDEEKEVT